MLYSKKLMAGLAKSQQHQQVNESDDLTSLTAYELEMICLGFDVFAWNVLEVCNILFCVVFLGLNRFRRDLLSQIDVKRLIICHAWHSHTFLCSLFRVQMLTNVLLLLSLISGCGISLAKQTAQRRIVGGDDAGFGSFPWQAYIRIGSSRYDSVSHSIKFIFYNLNNAMFERAEDCLTANFVHFV